MFENVIFLIRENYFIRSVIVGIFIAIILFPVYDAVYYMREKRKKKARDFVFYDSCGNRKWNFMCFLLVFTLIFLISFANFYLLFDGFTYGSDKGGNTVSVFGFYDDSCDSAYSSFENNKDKIEVLIPNWFGVYEDADLKENVSSDIDDKCTYEKIKEMPLIKNDTGGNSNDDAICAILKSEYLQNKLICNILNKVHEEDYYGITVDFKISKSEYKESYNSFILKLCRTLKADNRKVAFITSPEDILNNDLIENLDYIIVKMYDDNVLNTTEKPVAPFTWFNEKLNNLNIPKEKLVVSLANFGMDYTIDDKETPEVLSYSDVIEIINKEKISAEWDSKSKNPFVKYKKDEQNHIIWFLDAVTMYNQFKLSADKNIDKVALWQIGSEESTVWDMFGYGKINDVINNIGKFKNIKSARIADYTGDGETLNILSSGKDGSRNFELGIDNLILSEEYLSYPAPFGVELQGYSKNKEIALTFDDGPSPDFTPAILDILKKYNVPATFFVLGNNAKRCPDVVRRIYNEGHEIGNHTFTHPQFNLLSDASLELELYSNQNFIKYLTGHSTSLFRSPYSIGKKPTDAKQLAAVYKAQQLGYITVTGANDPDDWEKPSCEKLVSDTVSGFSKGNIIILHDGGGDRQNTVNALPRIIESAQKEGYTFVSVGKLLGKDKNEVCPPVKLSKIQYFTFNSGLYNISEFFGNLVYGLFILATIIGLARIAIVVVFSYRQQKRSKRKKINYCYNPYVTVIIPAYNEEKVICKAINSVLKSNYECFEIIVVDDGSTDNTESIVNKNYANNDLVNYIKIENRGKSAAINTGYKNAKGTVIVGIDADTTLAPDAITRIVKNFRDENVGAVCGNIKVGNVCNLLTLWQYIEYVIGANLDKRAYDELNCITVVPGAFGAWRKSAVSEAGYFKHNILAEDCDLTLSLIEKGYKIVYEDRALGYTEAPQDLKGLSKQRFRWTFGILQCLWEHKKSLFNVKRKWVGFFSLPSMLLFQYVFQPIAAFTEISFYIGLIFGLFGENLLFAVVIYLAYFLIDYSACVYAFKLENEKLTPLVWFIPLRVCYRFFITYIVLKSIGFAISGEFVNWNKLQRTGKVNN